MSPPCRPRRPAVALLALLSVTPCAGMETPPAPTPGPEPAPGPEAPAAWELGGSASQYFLPHDEDFLIPIVYANRGGLHLEARYNYENLDTGSLFAGWNYAHENRLRLEVTPMAGVMFGDREGLVPGFELTLGYGKFEAYTEFEYVFDREDTEANFLYNWSELSYAPVDWFRFGLTTQRTRVYQTDRDIQRALLLGLSVQKLTFTAHLFNPGSGDAFYVFAVGADF